MAMHVKKDDMVQVMTGDYKGATGKVLRVLCDENKVIVQGINLAKKHVRPSRRNPSGGRINIEQPIHISNVLPVNPKTSKGCKVRYEIGEDGGKRRVAKDGTKIGDIRYPEKK
ncbi:MAG: 50S ribosomal protein L24 [Sedimentisphaerales bacterium]|jgi:large subunit ribosomal protein L24